MLFSIFVFEENTQTAHWETIRQTVSVKGEGGDPSFRPTIPRRRELPARWVADASRGYRPWHSLVIFQWK